MDLRAQLKRTRAKAKEPFVRSAFTVVSALVRKHKLDQGFIDRLRQVAWPGAEWVLSQDLPAKGPDTLPLFSLASPEEYQVTREILAVWDNPYIPYARSPEELLLSRLLFQANPGLGPEVLSRVHFRTLLAREVIRQELAGLCPDPEKDGGAAAGRRAFFQSLLNQLDTLISLTKQEV